MCVFHGCSKFSLFAILRCRLEVASPSLLSCLVGSLCELLISIARGQWAAVWTWSLVRDVHASFGGIMVKDYAGFDILVLLLHL